LTKLKRLSEQQASNQASPAGQGNEADEFYQIEEAVIEEQPIYQVSLEVDEINIVFLKS
jgi:hypothetical protein